MNKLKFLNECSTEALKEVFNSELSERLNCSLAEHVLRQIAVELLERRENLNATAHDALIGEKYV